MSVWVGGGVGGYWEGETEPCSAVGAYLYIIRCREYNMIGNK